MVADGEGAYAAIECIGGETTGTVVKAIREEGTIFLYGALSGPTATIPIVDLLYKVGQLINPLSRSQGFHTRHTRNVDNATFLFVSGP